MFEYSPSNLGISLLQHSKKSNITGCDPPKVNSD